MIEQYVTLLIKMPTRKVIVNLKVSVGIIRNISYIYSPVERLNSQLLPTCNMIHSSNLLVGTHTIETISKKKLRKINFTVAYNGNLIDID